MPEYHKNMIDRWALIFLRKSYHEGIEEAKEWADRTVPKDAIKDIKEQMRYIKEKQDYRIKRKEDG